MGNGEKNVFERLFKLWAKVCKLIIEGRRDAESIALILQKIVDGAIGCLSLFERLVKECDFTGGREMSVNEENFPSKGVGASSQKKYKVFCFGEAPISSEAIVEAMDVEGFRPAQPIEFLTFLAKNPSEGLNYPIICLGHIWNDTVPGVWKNQAGRWLAFNSCKAAWSGGYRFLGVRK